MMRCTSDAVSALGEGETLPVNGKKRVLFGPGDILFAAAGESHRFDKFTEDFCTWVIFYGPEGGERGMTAEAPIDAP